MERIELARLLGATAAVSEGKPGPHVVIEREPARFMVQFAAAVAASGPVFLADPAWDAGARQTLSGISEKPDSTEGGGRGWLCVPCGGTGGALKWARHDEGTIHAAVAAFCRHFRVERVNALGVLPLHHVSGLMAWMRCAMSGGKYRAESWTSLALGELPRIDGDGWFLSLVPTQLRRLMESPASIDWLRRFRAVFVGGGPLWPELADRAALAKLPLSPGYGMTETAAMVAAVQPADFLRGARHCGSPLPHARVEIAKDGEVSISGDSVFRGYWPAFSSERTFATADRGMLDDQGNLTILGRIDLVIITGGEKVQPEEVEATLLQTGEFDDVGVVGVPDPYWGAAVVACFPEGTRTPDFDRVAEGLAALAPYKRPKRFVPLAVWPRNAQGKLNRASLGAALG